MKIFEEIKVIVDVLYLNILQCFNISFNIKYIFKNVGFYLSLILTIIQICFTVIYIKKYKNHLKDNIDELNKIYLKYKRKRRKK